jgi:hypothetical protein
VPLALPPATPPDFSNILLGEVQSMNWLFGAQATASGFDTDLINVGTPTAADPLQFDTVSKADLERQEGHAFAAMLFGSNWANEISSDPGSYSLFNGALTQFTDANNVLLYALMTGGAEIDATQVDVNDYLFGSDASITAALSGDSFWEDAGNFFQNGLADLGGYFAAAMDVS